MKTCKNKKFETYYKRQCHCESGGSKIRKLLLFLIVIIVLLTEFILAAEAEKLPITRTIEVVMRIKHKAKLEVDEAKIDERYFLADSKDLLKAVSPDSGNVTVENLTINGEKVIHVTRIFEEALY